MRTGLLLCLALLLAMLTAPSIAAGKIIFVSGGQLYRIAPDGSGLRKLTTAGGQSPIASYDGKTVAFRTKTGISLLDVASVKIRSLRVHNVETLIGFSPDGKQIFFTRQEENDEYKDRLYRIGVNGRNEQKTPFMIWTSSERFVSPNGKWYAMVDGTNLILVSPDGKQQRIVSKAPAGKDYTDLSDPAFSADGKRIAFAWGTTGDYTHGELYIVNTDGTKLKRLVGIKVNTIDSALEPYFSPDGRWIAFLVYRMWGPDPEKDTQAYLYVVKSDGTGLRRLSKCDNQFNFSLDGSAIVFDNGGEIWTVKLNGTGLRRLTKTHGNSSPVWVK
jgi:Tol biopolymer transport system component